MFEFVFPEKGGPFLIQKIRIEQNVLTVFVNHVLCDQFEPKALRKVNPANKLSSDSVLYQQMIEFVNSKQDARHSLFHTYLMGAGQRFVSDEDYAHGKLEEHESQAHYHIEFINHRHLTPKLLSLFLERLLANQKNELRMALIKRSWHFPANNYPHYLSESIAIELAIQYAKYNEIQQQLALHKPEKPTVCNLKSMLLNDLIDEELIGNAEASPTIQEQPPQCRLL